MLCLNGGHAGTSVDYQFRGAREKNICSLQWIRVVSLQLTASGMEVWEHGFRDAWNGNIQCLVPISRLPPDSDGARRPLVPLKLTPLRKAKLGLDLLRALGQRVKARSQAGIGTEHEHWRCGLETRHGRGSGLGCGGAGRY